MTSTSGNEDETGYDIGSTVRGASSSQESIAEPVMDTSSNGGTHQKFHIYTPELLFPNSSYLGSKPPLPPTSEAEFLSDILVCKFYTAVPFLTCRRKWTGVIVTPLRRI